MRAINPYSNINTVTEITKQNVNMQLRNDKGS